MHRSGMISIWFFIGALLLVYGVLICGSGLYELISPPAHYTIQMPELHAGIWWGALLIVMGLIYTVRFSPRKGE